MDEKVVYEKHPVTAERKAELRREGLQDHRRRSLRRMTDKHPEPIKAAKSGGASQKAEQE